MKFLSSPEIPVLDTPPASPGEGEMYYDSSLDSLRVYAEGEWRDATPTNTPLFIGDTAPVTDAPKYLWIETGLPEDGFTFWFEDGEGAQGGLDVDATGSASSIGSATAAATVESPASGVDSFATTSHYAYDITDFAPATFGPDNGRVHTLPDVSGNNRDAIGAAGSPWAVDNEPCPAVLLPGNSYFDIDQTGLPSTQPVTFVSLARNSSANTSAQYCLFLGGVGVQILTNDWMYQANSLVEGGTPDTNWHVIVAVFDGSNSAFYLDGGAPLMTGNPGTQGLGAAGRIGEVLNNNSRFWQGPFNFLALSPGDARTDLTTLNSVGSALAGRAGITWTDIT